MKNIVRYIALALNIIFLVILILGAFVGGVERTDWLFVFGFGVFAICNIYAIRKTNS